MGVLNQDPNLVDIINKLDDRLRALEQSRRFASPLTYPNNPIDGEISYTRSGESSFFRVANSQADNYLPQTTIYMGEWSTFSSGWYVGANQVSTQTANPPNIYEQIRYRVTGRMVNVEVAVISQSSLASGQWTFNLPILNDPRGISVGSGFTSVYGGGNIQPFIVQGILGKAYFLYADQVAAGSYSSAVSNNTTLVFSLTYEAAVVI